MTLFFVGAHERCIGHPQTEQEAYKLIHKFLDEHNYKSYYTQTYSPEPGNTHIDVGSWTEYFTLLDKTTDDKVQWSI